MVLTVPSDLSRARHRPGLHSELAAIAPGADLHVRSRRVTTSFVPLELSSEQCPSPNLLGRSGWVRKSSTAARFYSLGQLPERADDVKSVVSQKQPNVAKHDLLGRASSPGSPPTLTFCRASISGPQPSAVSQHQNRIPVRSRTRASIGPSGSPRSPAEPHPPSLAWVETPLPLGPLPPPPGPHKRQALQARSRRGI